MACPTGEKSDEERLATEDGVDFGGIQVKIFISYCEKDGEGLEYARRAKELCKKKA